MIKDYTTYYGYYAIKTLIKERPDSIEKLFVHYTLKKEFFVPRGVQVKYVDDKELEKISKSMHHEKVCAFATPLQVLSVNDFISANDPSTTFILDTVENAHNVGAIIRALTFFNYKSLILTHPLSLSGSVYRISKGAVEYIKVYKISHLEIFKLIDCGKTIVTTSVANDPDAMSFKDFDINPHSCIALGSEKHGISKIMKKASSSCMTIPGNKNIESLSVSQAAVLLGSHFSV